jgi:hypothetical protein
MGLYLASYDATTRGIGTNSSLPFTFTCSITVSTWSQSSKSSLLNVLKCCSSGGSGRWGPSSSSSGSTDARAFLALDFFGASSATVFGDANIVRCVRRCGHSRSCSCSSRSRSLLAWCLRLWWCRSLLAWCLRLWWCLLWWWHRRRFIAATIVVPHRSFLLWRREGRPWRERLLGATIGAGHGYDFVHGSWNAMRSLR